MTAATMAPGGRPRIGRARRAVAAILAGLLATTGLVLAPNPVGAEDPVEYVGDVAFFTDASMDRPDGIVTGPDGNLWFTNWGNNTIGRITPTGEITQFTDETISGPTEIALGSDGNLWFTNGGNDSIGRITPEGEVTNFTDPSIDEPLSIAAGPGGDLWFTNAPGAVMGMSIGRITTEGVVTNFPGGPGGALGAHRLTAGPDGNIWFTSVWGAIGRMTPEGAFTTFTDPALTIPQGITAGPDGNLWFADLLSDSIGRITPDGVVSTFTVPGMDAPQNITAGPDGNLWWTASQRVGRITPDGEATTFQELQGALGDITTGPDGQIWYTRFTFGSIARLVAVGAEKTGSITATVAEVAGADPIYYRMMLTKPDDGSVFIEGNPPGPWTFTDLAAGTYLVTLWAGGPGINGAVVATREVTIADGEAAAVTMAADVRESCVSGQVRSADGSPLPNLYLSGDQPGGEGYPQVIPEGTPSPAAFSFWCGLAGTFEIRADDAELFETVATATVTVAPGGSAFVDLVVGVVDRGPVTEASGASLIGDGEGGSLVRVWNGSEAPVGLTFPVECPGGGTPTSVALVNGGNSHPASAVGDGTYTATIPREEVVPGTLTVDASCDDDAVVVSLGSIALFDPSGVVSDLSTGAPISDATVTLYRVPDWAPRGGPEDVAEGTCESNLSKEDGAAWSQPAPVELGELAEVDGGTMSPNVASQVTGADGRYAWDVAFGCWYVTVEADGYEPLTSPVVGVPPEVTDLDLALTALTTVPGAPTAVVGVAGDEEVVVSWSAPASDGGSPITGYTVTADPGGASCTTAGATTCTVDGLDNGTAYTFTVVATNEVGDGPVSAASAPVTPQAPVGPSACDDGAEGAFVDVPAGHVFCEDVAWLADRGVTGGYTDDTFRPGAPVTRGSMAAFLYRYAGEPEFEAPAVSPFTDVSTGHVFYKEITWLAETGVTGGYTDDTFRPAAPVTRGSMAAFLYRFAGEPPFVAGAPSFIDVPVSHPFFDEVEWLVAVGVTGGFTPDTFRPGASVTRGSMAAFLHRFDALD